VRKDADDNSCKHAGVHSSSAASFLNLAVELETHRYKQLTPLGPFSATKKRKKERKNKRKTARKSFDFSLSFFLLFLFLFPLFFRTMAIVPEESYCYLTIQNSRRDRKITRKRDLRMR